MSELLGQYVTWTYRGTLITAMTREELEAAFSDLAEHHQHLQEKLDKYRMLAPGKVAAKGAGYKDRG